MKFFKCHSQKMKEDKVICLQNKFTDIGPDVFDGFNVEYIVLADTTKAIRNYAFSGTGKCCIYLPKAIEEIEPLAFENISPETVFFCVRGSYASIICAQHGLNINNNVNEIFSLVEEQKRLIAEQKQIAEEQKRIMEEQKRMLEEQRKMLEEQRRKEEEERQNALRAQRELEAKIEAEKIAMQKLALEEERKALEAQRQAMLKQKEENEKILKQEKEEPKQEQNSAQKDKEINIYIFDKSKGAKNNSMMFSQLSATEKENVTEEGALYIYREFVKGSRKDTYITEKEYLDFVNGLTAEMASKNDNASKNNKTTPKPRTRICPFCSEALLDSDVFCAYCGKKVQDIKFCSECGEVNDISDNFCCNCGIKF